MVPSIKFTHEISYNSVNFLDTKVIKDKKGNITTDVYGYPPIPALAHPLHLKYSIPYSQALRLRRICSSTHVLEQRIWEYSNFFVACGYKKDGVLSEMQKSLLLTQEESLRTRERHTTTRIPLVTTYNPHTSYIAEMANRNWHFLQSKERLARIFKEQPLIAYRRPKSLRDVLVSTKLRGKTTNDQTTTLGSCGPCNKPKCSCCGLINRTATFTGTRQDGKVFDIFHTVDCQSTFVIYIIECRICRLQHVGKSETAFNLRLNNHRNHTKRGVSSCELTEHFLHNSRSHNFDNDVTITIIEQIKRSDKAIERKKEIL